MTHIRYEICRTADVFTLPHLAAAFPTTCRVSITGHDGRVIEMLEVGGRSRAQATRRAKAFFGSRLSRDYPQSKITFHDARRARVTQ